MTSLTTPCSTQNSSSFRCCSQSDSDILYHFSYTLPQYWAFNISVPSESMSITTFATQESSVIGSLVLDPFSTTSQSTGSMSGSASIYGAVPLISLVNVWDYLLFLDINAPFEQGARLDVLTLQSSLVIWQATSFLNRGE